MPLQPGPSVEKALVHFSLLGAMSWQDVATIVVVVVLVMAWMLLRIALTFGKRAEHERIPTPNIDRRNREALDSMASLDEIAERAANEPAPADLIEAVELPPDVKRDKTLDEKLNNKSENS